MNRKRIKVILKPTNEIDLPALFPGMTVETSDRARGELPAFVVLSVAVADMDHVVEALRNDAKIERFTILVNA